MLTFENIKSLFEFSPNAYLVLLPDTPRFTVVTANKAFFNFTSTTPEIIGKGIFDAFSENTVQSDLNLIKNALENVISQKTNQKAVLQNSGLVFSNNNEVQFYSIEIFPLLNKKNEVEFIALHIATDTEKNFSTELQSQKDQIANYYKRIANILDSITDGFFAVDHDWIVTHWNEEANRLLGVPKQHIIGKNLWEVFPKAVSTRFFSEQHKAMLDKIPVRFDEYSPTAKSFIEVTAFPSENGLSVHFKDITERKNADEQLNQERERYYTLFNLSPIAKWVYDVDTLRFLDVNNAAINHYGYSREEFLSMTIKDIRPEWEVEILEEIINHKLKEGLPNSSFVKHKRKFGDVIHVNITGSTIQWKDKSARLVVAIDNTEKLKAKQQLEASEQRFKALVQDGSDLIAIMDEQGNYLYVSPTSKPILGINAEYFIGKNAFEFIHPQDKPLVINQFAQLENKKRIKLAPFRFEGNNNKYVWIETVITDMTDDPAVGGVVANSRNVTQRIENEIKTKESIDRYNIVSKATSDAIWDWDIISGKIVWNKGVKGIFGYKQLSFTQGWWSENVHPGDLARLSTQLDQLVKKKKSRVESEFRFRSADGTYKHVLDRAFILFNAAGEPMRMIGAMQDITERVNYVQAIEEKNKRLSDIAWTQSHIVRTPVSRMLGLADLLSDCDDEEERKRMLLYLKASAEELDTIIRDIAKKA